MKLLPALLLLASAVQDPALVEFGPPFDPASVTVWDAKVAVADGGRLRVDTFHAQEWPGITFKAPRGHWDVSRHGRIAVDVTNLGKTPLPLNLRIDSGESDGLQNCNTGGLTLAPGARGTLSVEFAVRSGAPEGLKLFGMRGFPGSRYQTIDPSRVTQLILFLARPREDYRFEIGPLRASGEAALRKDQAPADPKTFLPFIDELGQYVHRDWPGKATVADLKRRATDETFDPGPKGWTKYGGWAAGPTEEATGYFHAKKRGERWWLIDPEGKLFFSHGIDCVDPRGATPVEERDGWFRGWPSRDDAAWKEFFHPAREVLHGHYAGRKPLCFDITAANLFRKYGPEWKQRSADAAHRRLRSWGMNTIGNWSDEAVCLERRTPYVVAIHFGGRPIQGSEGYWGQFRDVFDEPAFLQPLRDRLKWEVTRSAGDPWCVGYFVDNELSWGDDTTLAVATLRSPSGQPAKKVFVDDLKAKYATIDALNSAWGGGHKSWEALLSHREPPDAARARADLLAFNAKTTERYFKLCRDAVKEVAPRNLYLGCRFAWVNPQAAEIAAKYCDVVSFNIYQRITDSFTFPLKADVPILIGEFHFGALDRGPFHPGIIPARSQEERARFYGEYLAAARRHPQIVGCHWFQYRDQPTTGRSLDGENYQIGFVDIADTPYPEIVAAARKVGEALYR